jgi:PAS domain S-box-containing protein
MDFKNEKIKLLNKANFIWVSIGLVALAWTLDPLMDFLIFHETNVIGQIITPTNHQIATRLFFGSIFILFGIFIQFSVTRSKKAEDALKGAVRNMEGAVIKAEDEKNKTNEIIEAIGDGIILQDTDYKIVYQNQIQNKIYGNHNGEYCYKVYEGKDSICEDCPIELSFKDGKIHKAERRIPTDKGILYLELTGSSLKDSTGKIIGGVKVVRNVTEQKRAEEKLRNGELFLGNIFTSIQDGIGVIDKDMNILRVNRTAESWYPHAAPLVGKKCYEAYHKRSEPCETCPAWKTLKTGESAYNVVPKHGAGEKEVGWLEIYSYPMIDTATGEMRGAIEYVRDITERKRMVEELRRAHDELELRIQERTAELVKTNETLQAEITERKSAEEKYRTLIDNNQDGVFIIQDAKMQFVNEAFARVVGYTEEEVIGKDFRELVAPEDLEIVADRYYRRQAGEDVPREYEFHMMHKDGRTRMLINMNVGLITYRGRVASMGTVKDITEKKKLESQLLRSQRMESIGTLSNGIAHDINNVLTPIMLSQELLRERLTDEESKRLLNTIERSTHRGANLMKQVLSFTKGIEGERNALQVANLISEIRQMAKETFPRNIEIRTDIPKDLWTISGDATQLHQVIMNLCVNARDAMSNGGILNISVENLFIDEDYKRMNSEAKIGPYIVTTVSDTGTGMPADIVDRIFEPFFTTKEHGKGTGLGLSTSLGIVRSHGGFITVYSEVGEGTAFKVYLPAITTSETLTAQEHQYKLPAGNGESILVVDDEDQVRETTKKTLETHGYKVITANDGKEAIALYSQYKEEIKLVLMDMMMPIMDGSASIREIHKINPEIKIIAVSGLTEKDKLAKIADLTNAFLSKPYATENLLKTTHEVLSAK